MRVLLIEDDSAMARSIELMLRSEGLNVYTTDLGEEGIDLGKLYEYDIIVLDLQLPDMSGYEVLKALRVAKVQTPVLILSGNAIVEAKVKALGFGAARARIGVNATGLPFNSVMAIELNGGRPMNPMVNAGAIAATSLAPGANAEERWRFIRDGLSRFAGRELAMDQVVYESEAASNQRNQGIARLLHGYGRLYADPDEATELYTRQCALNVTARDMAAMGATLAAGGVNPITGRRVVDADRCQRVLAVLATAMKLAQAQNVVREGWNGFNVLHTAAGRVGAPTAI
jgi:glutaminase